MRKYFMILGGYLQNNNIITNEIWNYEIAWAPQYYYLGNSQNNSLVERGNKWT